MLDSSVKVAPALSALTVNIKRNKCSLAVSSVVFLPNLLFLTIVFSQCHSGIYADGGFNSVFMDGCKSAIVPNSLLSSSPPVRLLVNVGDAETPQAESGVWFYYRNNADIKTYSDMLNVFKSLSPIKICLVYSFRYIHSKMKQNPIPQHTWL